MKNFALLTGFTLELSFPVAQTGAAHHVTVLSTTVPLLTNSVVVAIIMAPLCRFKDVCWLVNKPSKEFPVNSSFTHIHTVVIAHNKLVPEFNIVWLKADNTNLRHEPPHLWMPCLMTSTNMSGKASMGNSMEFELHMCFTSLRITKNMKHNTFVIGKRSPMLE